VIALVVFGPKNLPQLGRALGRAMREFRRASDEFRSTIETNLQINEPDPPPVSPLETAPPEASPAVESGRASVEEAVAGEAGVEPETSAPSGEPYLSQRGAKLFHTRDCGWVKRIPEAERVYFKRVSEAKEAGLGACPVCDPWESA
jgi:TatA/E family protein of Tat protein translocase